MNNNFYIYLHKRSNNNQVFYVGKGAEGNLVLDMETGIYYNSITEASLSYLYHKGHLNRMIKGDRKNKTNLQYV